LDLREAACDSLILVNNTFVNYQDRPIRHYNFGNPLAGTGNINYCLIDHNSFVNGMGFHGLLSLGNVGSEVIITNNLFYDAFAAGEDENEPNGTRAAEWANTGETYPNGTNRMVWIFTAPNDTTQWTVSNNYYVVSDSGQAFLDANGLNVGSQLSWHINSRLGADSVNAFTMADLTLTNIPKLMTNLMRWYRSPSGGNFTKNTPNSAIFNWRTDDMDRRGYRYYSDTLDVSYSTTSAAYTGSLGGFPVGDLNWFPDKKTEWEDWVTDVDDQVNYVPSAFSLEQNYPNPFNPSTQISFNLDKPGFTTLVVYNVIGQKVATLASKELSAGRHTFSFDAINLSSGIYFYELESGGNRAAMKMILMK
jgi:hypothetical protein